MSCRAISQQPVLVTYDDGTQELVPRNTTLGWQLPTAFHGKIAIRMRRTPPNLDMRALNREVVIMRRTPPNLDMRALNPEVVIQMPTMNQIKVKLPIQKNFKPSKIDVISSVAIAMGLAFAIFMLTNTRE